MSHEPKRIALHLSLSEARALSEVLKFATNGSLDTLLIAPGAGSLLRSLAVRVDSEMFTADIMGRWRPTHQITLPSGLSLLILLDDGVGFDARAWLACKGDLKSRCADEYRRVALIRSRIDLCDRHEGGHLVVSHNGDACLVTDIRTATRPGRLAFVVSKEMEGVIAARLPEVIDALPPLPDLRALALKFGEDSRDGAEREGSGVSTVAGGPELDRIFEELIRVISDTERPTPEEQRTRDALLDYLRDVARLN